jgi:hypothetical protein
MISVLIDYKLDKYNREIKYTFDYIFETLGLSHRFITNPTNLRQHDILLLYGLIEPTLDELQAMAKQYITIFIQSDSKLYVQNGYAPDQLRRLLRDIKLFNQTPVIAERKFEYPAENYSEIDIHACKINFDLPGNIFYHLSNREEQCDPNRDQYNCLPEGNSAFYKWKDTPFIDNFLWLLDNLIKEQARQKKQYIVQKHSWPKAQDMAVALSHSVDDLQKWDLNSILMSVLDDLALLVTLRWQLLYRNIWSKLKYIFTNFEIYWNFQEFIALEKTHNFHSTWFIAAEQTADIDYTLDDADLQDEMRLILKQGNEIALLTTDDKLNRDDFVNRKQIMLRQLQEEQIGIRQQGYHLGEKIRDLHQRLFPYYDSSTSFLDTAGFRNGMVFPYKPWIANLESNHLEIPIVFKDQFLKLSRFRTVSLEDAKQMLKKTFQAVRRRKGLFSLDFTVANYSDIPYCNKLYAYILALIKAENAWVVNMCELAQWWEKRSKVTIEEGEFDISIKFPEALDSFVIQIYGDAKIKSVEFPHAKIEGNCVFFSDIEAGADAVIELNQTESVLQNNTSVEL